MSRPSRARGLKRERREVLDALRDVAPFAGAWIETYDRLGGLLRSQGRALRGRVD